MFGVVDGREFEHLEVALCDKGVDGNTVEHGEHHHPEEHEAPRLLWVRVPATVVVRLRRQQRTHLQMDFIFIIK